MIVCIYLILTSYKVDANSVNAESNYPINSTDLFKASLQPDNWVLQLEFDLFSLSLLIFTLIIFLKTSKLISSAKYDFIIRKWTYLNFKSLRYAINYNKANLQFWRQKPQNDTPLTTDNAVDLSNPLERLNNKGQESKDVETVDVVTIDSDNKSIEIDKVAGNQKADTRINIGTNTKLQEIESQQPTPLEKSPVGRLTQVPDKAEENSIAIELSSGVAVNQKVTERQQVFYQKFEKIVENHYQDKAFGQQQIADLMFISTKQLRRKIRSHYQQSPAEYLKDIRLTKGSLLLKQGLSVCEVAYSVGFSSQSYFSSCFKGKFGKSPSSFI